MLHPDFIIDLCAYLKLDFVTGVPDSVLAPAIDSLDTSSLHHVRATHEGSAVGMAIGEYLSSGKPSLVYLQNSGLSNALNPLLSLAHRDVYNIPMLLVVGWRGRPGLEDEPQHMVQGAVTEQMVGFFSNLTIELKDYPETAVLDQISGVLGNGGTVTLLIPPKSVSKREFAHAQGAYSDHTLRRPDFIEALLDASGPGDLIVSTTGYTSRELAYYAEKKGSPAPYFLCVGGMGHVGSIATQAAKSWNGRVLCLDGDGSLLMHMGAFVLSGERATPNLTYILFNNGVHESVGTQPVAVYGADFNSLASSFGFEIVSNQDLLALWQNPDSQSSSARFCELDITPGTIEDLPRPERKPSELILRVSKAWG